MPSSVREFVHTSPPIGRRLNTIRDRDLLTLAILLGISAGMAEALHGTFLYWILHQASGQWVAGQVYWMAPLAACTTLLLFTLLFLLARRLTRTGAESNLAALLTLTAACAFSVARVFLPGIHPLALAVLSSGFAVQITNAVSTRPDYLRFAQRGALAGTAVVALWGLASPLLSGLHGEPARTPATAPPNILLLLWDTVRARSLSLYGSERATTPNLDAFARQAVVFENAISTAPWTLPSHASLFTGRFHHEHGADRNAPLDRKYLTLAEALGRLGYQTAGFAANTYWVGRGFGLDRGFELYEDQRRVSLHSVFDSWWLSEHLHNAMQKRLGRHEPNARVRAEKINRSFLEWVDRRDDRPFFAFLNVFDAHEPYLPPRAFGFRFAAGTPRYHWDYTTPTTYSARELQELRDAYDSSIYYLDHQLGVLLAALERRGLLNNTVIVITSDHGETLGEHQPDLLGHESSVYYDVLHVPLVIYHPSRRQGGLRSRAPVSLADVPATLVDLVTGGGINNPFPGTPLLPIAAHPNDSVTRPTRALLSQANPATWHTGKLSWPISTGPLLSLIDGTDHYIINGRREEQLFDVAADPWERRDLSKTPDGRLRTARYRNQLTRMRIPGF